MSADKTNMKVLNDEYDRILANPDGLIMSEGLAERLEGDWNLGAALDRLQDMPEDAADPIHPHIEAVPSPEKNSVRVFCKDNENLGIIYGDLQGFSSNDGQYSMTMLVRGDQKKFMNVLQRIQDFDSFQEDAGLDVAGRNGFIAIDIDLESWSFTKINSYDTSLMINFRSKHVEF
tara:strand:- start:1294 stop:1818 length:525 start_codon:yes stop_codon:yes gene_type:complete